MILILGIIRLYLQRNLRRKGLLADVTTGHARCIGDMEVQADDHHIEQNEAGLLILLADGFGKGKLGKVASGAAIDACITLYQQYKNLDQPQYYFKRAFNLANFQVLKYLEGRTGGTSLGAVFIHKGQLVYALVGDVQLFVFRNNELIPLSEGHTLGKLAKTAYTEGKLTRQKALWIIWNYIGQDGFKEIEYYDMPVNLKAGDSIVMMTKGVYQNIKHCQIESVLSQQHLSSQEKAEQLIQLVAALGNSNRENATAVITTIHRTRKDIV